MRDKHLKYLLILPAFLLVTATVIYPLGFAGVTSFMDWRLSRSQRPTDFVGLENYLRAFLDDDSFLNSLWVTGVFVAGSAIGAVVVGLLIALLLSRQGRWYTAVRTFLVLPFAMSPALQGSSFRFFLNPEFGIFDKTINFLLPFTESIDWLGESEWALTWLILTDMWHWSPFLSLMLIGGLLSIPKETHESARVDGASSWTIFWTVTLPLLMPVMAVALILKTIFSFKMFDYVFLLTGGGPGESTTTMTYYAFRMGFATYDMGYASAIAFSLAIILVGISFIYFRLLFPKEPA